MIAGAAAVSIAALVKDRKKVRAAAALVLNAAAAVFTLWAQAR